MSLQLRGIGDGCSSALAPGVCESYGGTYDGNNEVCDCGTTTSTGMTVAQMQALCSTSAAMSWDSSTNTCVPVSSAASTPGVTSCANNNWPGTPLDVNCPFWCDLIGYLGNGCTPCHSTCPAGTVWDTTNDVCSASPAATNCISAVATCPSYCEIPFIGGLISGCASCSPTLGGSLAGIGGIAIAVGAVYLAYKILVKK